MLHLMVTMTIEYITSDDMKYCTRKTGKLDVQEKWVWTPRWTYNLQQSRVRREDDVLSESIFCAQCKTNTKWNIKTL